MAVPRLHSLLIVWIETLALVAAKTVRLKLEVYLLFKTLVFRLAECLHF